MRPPSFKLDSLYVVALAVLGLSGSMFAIEQYAGFSIAGEAAPMYGTLHEHEAAAEKPLLKVRAQSGSIKELRKDVRKARKEVKKAARERKHTIKRKIKTERIERKTERRIKLKTDTHHVRPALRCIVRSIRNTDAACRLRKPRTGSGATNGAVEPSVTTRSGSME